jgi:hypothetical protein
MNTRMKNETESLGYDAWIGRDAYYNNGDKVGKIEAI